MSPLTIFTDGACIGNPGPMGIGIVIYRNGVRIEELSEPLGRGTNNTAEYTAIIRALEAAHSLGENIVCIKSDSELVVRQLNNEYKVKDLQLKQFKKRIDALRSNLKVTFEHIPRERNNEADLLSKEAAERAKL